MNPFIEIDINGYPALFILWNLFLASIPCYLAWYFEKLSRQPAGAKGLSPLRALIFLAWLFFLPNTAYLITMVRHLVGHCSNYNAYDVCLNEGWMVPFFFAYAAIGIPTFWYALKTIAKALQGLTSLKINPAFPLLMLPVTAFGIVLGLFPRLNSWQILTDPLLIARISLKYVTDPIMLLNFLVYTLALGIIYYGAELLYRKAAGEDKDHRLQ